MILDRLSHASLYRNLSPGIAAGFDFLCKTDLTSLSPGRNEIDGDRVFAMVNRYQPRPMEQIIWESHRKYLDIQYMVQGLERIGYIPLDAGVKVTAAYDEAKDAAFYKGVGEMFHVPAGSFALFYPQDIHAPGLVPSAGDAGEVLKVVVKVAV